VLCEEGAAVNEATILAFFDYFFTFPTELSKITFDDTRVNHNNGGNMCAYLQLTDLTYDNSGVYTARFYGYHRTTYHSIHIYPGDMGGGPFYTTMDELGNINRIAYWYGAIEGTTYIDDIDTVMRMLTAKPNSYVELRNEGGSVCTQTLRFRLSDDAENPLIIIND